ncbi:MAG: ABC transporter permease subunit [Proteobacteria bacterium]|nr:ABC transporter permease subunit [Pseudomonadota bacterium]
MKAAALLAAAPRAARQGRYVPLLLIPAVLLLIFGFAAPIGTLLAWSLNAPNWSLVYYRELFEDAAYWTVLLNTIRLSAEVTLLCSLLGYPIAYAMAQASPAARSAIAILLIVPVWTSILVRGFAWMVLLGRNGAVNNLLIAVGFTDKPIEMLYGHAAVLIGLVHVMLPYFVFPLYDSMKRIDPRLVSAAESLGAGRMTAFFSVFLPLSIPGIASGGLLVLILSMGIYVTPAMLGGLRETTTVMMIEKQINLVANWQMAAAMSLVLLATAMAFVLAWAKLFGFGADERAHNSAGRATIAFHLGLATTKWVCWLTRLRIRLFGPRRARTEGALRQRRPRRLFAMIVTLLALAFIVAPIMVFFPLSLNGAGFLEFPPRSYSLRWYENYFSRQDWIRPTITSFQVAFLTTIVAVPVGALAAIAIERGKFRGRLASLGLLTMPAMTPHLIIAVGLYFQYATIGWLGSIHGLVLAHLVLALPLVVIVIQGALRKVDIAPENAARSLGAHPAIAFYKITLPMIRPAILSAGLFAFLASFDDVIMALFLTTTTLMTLPRRMWAGIVYEVDPTLTVASIVLITLTIVLLTIILLVDRRNATKV